MISRDLKSVVGIDELRSNAAKNGTVYSDIDMSIADVIFKLSSSTVKYTIKDEDGLSVYNTDGFIYNEQIDSLIQSFPAAANLLSSLDRDINYGFVDENGTIHRTGMMGDKDPIRDARDMVDAYLNRNSKGSMLYASEGAYKRAKDAERDANFRRRYGDSYGRSAESLYQYLYNEVPHHEAEEVHHYYN